LVENFIHLGLNQGAGCMKLILGLVFQIGGLGVSETRVTSINGHVSNLNSYLLPHDVIPRYVT
jgi:hypothetical protein